MYSTSRCFRHALESSDWSEGNYKWIKNFNLQGWKYSAGIKVLLSGLRETNWIRPTRHVSRLTLVKNEQPLSETQATAPAAAGKGSQPSPAPTTTYCLFSQRPFSQSYLAFRRFVITGTFHSERREWERVTVSITHGFCICIWLWTERTHLDRWTPLVPNRSCVRRIPTSRALWVSSSPRRRQGWGRNEAWIKFPYPWWHEKGCSIKHVVWEWRRKKKKYYANSWHTMRRRDSNPNPGGVTEKVWRLSHLYHGEENYFLCINVWRTFFFYPFIVAFTVVERS